MCIQNYNIDITYKYSKMDKPRKSSHSFESECLNGYFSEFLLDYVETISDLDKDEYIRFDICSLYYDRYENRYFEDDHIKTIICKGD